MLAVLLLLALGFQLLLPSRADLSPVALTPSTRIALPPVIVVPAAVAPVIAGRNIFIPAGTGGETAPAGRPVLLGIASSGGGGAAVMQAGGVSRTVRPGDRIGSWRVGSIGRATVRLVGPDGTISLRIGEEPPATTTTSSDEGSAQ